MTFLAPFAFWGLLALAVPLALHLRRRRVGRTIQVGSLRHLESLPTAERRGIRLREPWLLLLRAAILSLLVLLLARPGLDRPAGVRSPFALVDSAAPQSLRDSLGATATLRVERLDDPWRRLEELDDSLPPGVALIVAASTRSDRYRGPRPGMGREVTWLAIADSGAIVVPSVAAASAPRVTDPLQRRALAAAAAAVAAEFGPLSDTAGWTGRLPEWWRDSLDHPAFAVAAALALEPLRTRPAPVTLATAQLLPARVTTVGTGAGRIDLHWWAWGLALLLFALERWWTMRRGESA